MLSAAVITVAVAILCFYAQAWLEKMEAESDSLAAELWEDETRAFAWRWLARKRKAKSKLRARGRRGLR